MMVDNVKTIQVADPEPSIPSSTGNRFSSSPKPPYVAKCFTKDTDLLPTSNISPTSTRVQPDNGDFAAHRLLFARGGIYYGIIYVNFHNF